MSKQAQSNSGGSWLLVVFGVFLVIVGLPLVYGGVQLVFANGSWYYALAGIGLILAGILYSLRNKAGFWLYALIYLATIIWALWEAGLAFWPLIPRLVAPTVLITLALLLLPAFTDSGRKRGPFALAGLFAVALVVTGYYALQPHEVTRNAFAGTSSTSPAAAEAGTDWRSYGRTPAGTRYAPIDQINKDNVKGLEVAWTYQTGDAPQGSAADQSTPIFVDGTLYACSPSNIVHALDPDTGEVKWKFDPKGELVDRLRCRGVSYYEPSQAPAASTPADDTASSDTAPAGDAASTTANNACAARIVLTTVDTRLIELDAKTGKPCADFGNNGVVDLKQGMGDVEPNFYYQTSAPTVMRDLIMVGGWVWDNQQTDEPSGAVRAFNAMTGELVWAWDVGNPNITQLPPEGESYTRGTPNVWSTPAYDDKLGLVYLPTGNATPDFWGGDRTQAAEDYSSSVVALDIATGRERWKFQTVHHDIWDLDVASQPALYDVPDGKGDAIPALIQVTKRGQIFMLDRRDGTPITEVEERPVPQGALEGDWTAETQPYSVGMPQIGVEPFTEARMWGATPLDQLYCRLAFKKMRYDGEFTPPRTDYSLIYPGYLGGMNWGSASVDEGNGLLIVNDIRLAYTVKLLAREEADQRDPGNTHGGFAPQRGTPYGKLGVIFMSPLDVPCQQPPYGTISAIDLASRQLVWQIPAGTLEETGPLGWKTRLPIPIGMPSLGGPMTTAGGLVFYAGTQDYYLRAMDVTTGEELWKGPLPVGAQATPMTYTSPETGRQYVVISAGGASQSPDRGDYIIAYALPENS